MSPGPEGSRDGGAGLPRPDPSLVARLEVVVLLLLGVGGAWLLGLLLWPFLAALVTSAVLALLVHPAYRWLDERMSGHRDMAALLVTVVAFFLVLLPMVGLFLVLVDQLGSGLDRLARGTADLIGPGGRLRGWVETAAAYLGLEEAELSSALSRQARDVVSLVARRTLGFLSGIGGWIFQAGAALFTLFYLLRDADELVGTAKWLVPLEPDATDRLFRKARDVTYATVYGNVVVAVVQGLLGGLAFWLLDVPAAAVWGTVMGLLSLLPALSATLVWLPAGLILIAGGRTLAGLAMLAFGAVVVSTVDNVLRATLVSGRAQMHPLAVFFSVLGGLLIFGAVGLLVGPVLFALAITVVEMARTALEPAVSEPGEAPVGEAATEEGGGDGSAPA